MPSEPRDLFQTFALAARAFPANVAVEDGRRNVRYAELHDLACQIADHCRRSGEAGHVVGIFGAKGLTAYAGILGALCSGAGYVPLDPTFPTARLVAMITDVGVASILVERQFASQFAELLAQVPFQVRVYLLDAERAAPLITGPTVMGIGSPSIAHRAGETAETAPAYVLFTSGTTGRPKGVAISHENILSYIQYMSAVVALAPEDRASQLFGLTFDLSVHDMFLTWAAGACLVVPGPHDHLAPRNYLKNRELTAFFSVPTLVAAGLGRLPSASFPKLRVSLFCGEPLHESLVDKWTAIAPNSRVLNLYGPTEATVAISHYEWTQKEPHRTGNGIVSIGTVFPGHRYAIVDADMNPLELGGKGELLLSGPQVAPGYINTPQETERRFVRRVDEPDSIWYRTGDIVRQGPEGLLEYCGRNDEQVKVAGFRVELAEVEFHLRQASGSDIVVVGCRRNQNGHVVGLIAVLQEEMRNEEGAILAELRKRLPPYMIPTAFRFVDALPTNARGKIDRVQVDTICNGAAADDARD